MIQNSYFESLQKSLLSREMAMFNAVIKENYDWAVNDTNRRGVLGPGVGAAFVEHELSKAIRGRMKDVAVELAEVDLNRSKLDSILKSLFAQYIVLAENLLKKPAVWGPPKDEESQRHMKHWTKISKPALWTYFESEFSSTLTKRSISKKIKVRQTLVWLIIGAAISRFGDLINMAEKAVETLKNLMAGQ